jgi:hypothetical protein
MELKRITVDARDVQALTGKSYSYCTKTILIIRKQLGKERHQLVTVKELCEYLKIPIEDCIEQLKLR